MAAATPRRWMVLAFCLVFSLESASRGGAPKPVPTKADIPFGPHPHQRLDIYLPPKGVGPFPVVIWFRGLWAPSKNVPPIDRFFPAQCAAASVQTRVMGDAIQEKLSPPVSVCLLDARRAVQFVRLHAAEWNLDPQRIAVAGSSQGALPALYVACAGERANPASTDPVERVSTKVACVGAHRSQPSIDPQRMQQWVPGVQWGVPAWGCSFAESLKRRDELLPLISKWTPEALLNKDTPPIYFENNWGLTRPDGVEEMDYLVHSPRWGLGFQKMAQERGATCYVNYSGHPSTKYADIWDFLVQEVRSGSKAGGVLNKVLDKSETLAQASPGRTTWQPLAAKAKVGGLGYRTTAGEGNTQIPVVVVRGTPYEMGWHLGRLTRDQMQQFIPAAMARLKPALGVTDQGLQDAWSRMAAYSDDRFEQELIGLSDSSGVPLALLQSAHVIPLLMPYSCSSIAAWGKATEDSHLYQTRNLDWKLAVRAHDFPVVVVYLPARGIAHVVPTFAGVIGAHTGMNVRGIVLSQMGDSPAREAPYDLLAPHFTLFFRSLLYDADSLSRALEIFKALPHTKRYHYVFGDGQAEHRAVKIRAHMPAPRERRMLIWKDNDPTDEFAPRVLENVVYNDEGRGAYPLLQQDYGTLNAEKLIRIANKIPIRGGNVVNVVYDATALKLWVSYAKGEQEAYKRPYTLVDLKKLACGQ